MFEQNKPSPRAPSATQNRGWAISGGVLAASATVVGGLAWAGALREGTAVADVPTQTHDTNAFHRDAVSSESSPSVTRGFSLNDLESLGQRLFEDTALSNPPGQACSSCHDAARAFSGDAGSRIEGIAAGSRPGVFGNRNVPMITYASFRPPFSFIHDVDEHGVSHDEPVGGFFWDGRAGSLAEQAKGPLLNPREMNNANPASVVSKVRSASYAVIFRSVFGNTALDDDGRAFQLIAESIASYEQSARFHRFSSKFDDYLRQKGQLDPTEARGLELFEDPQKGNCIACHMGNPHSRNPTDWLFTDFTFDALGLPRNAQIPDNADPGSFDLGLCDRTDLMSKAPSGFDIDSVCGAFQVPSLRNVALTAPYGHNGVFATLRDVVSFYATRDTNRDRWYPKSAGHARAFDDLPARYLANVNHDEPPYDRTLGQLPRLNDQEIDALVAFLETLTDR